MNIGERLRRAWWMHEVNATEAESTNKPIIDQLIANAMAAAAADVVTVALANMEEARDIRLQRVAILKEQLEIELMHADIDGTLVHARDCDEGRPECSCGAMQEAEARAIELVKAGRLTVSREPLADITSRVMATINANKRNSVVVKRDSAQLIVDHTAIGMDCGHCGRPSSEHLNGAHPRST